MFYFIIRSYTLNIISKSNIIKPITFNHIWWCQICYQFPIKFHYVFLSSKKEWIFFIYIVLLNAFDVIVDIQPSSLVYFMGKTYLLVSLTSPYVPTNAGLRWSKALLPFWRSPPRFSCTPTTLKSSWTILSHVFLGLPLGLLPWTSKSRTTLHMSKPLHSSCLHRINNLCQQIVQHPYIPESEKFRYGCEALYPIRLATALQRCIHAYLEPYPINYRSWLWQRPLEAPAWNENFTFRTFSSVATTKTTDLL